MQDTPITIKLNFIKIVNANKIPKPNKIILYESSSVVLSFLLFPVHFMVVVFGMYILVIMTFRIYVLIIYIIIRPVIALSILVLGLDFNF